MSDSELTVSPRPQGRDGRKTQVLKLISGPRAHAFGLLIIRSIVGVVMMFHGAQKLFGAFGGSGISGFAGFLTKMDFPLPTLNAWMAAGAEFFGGALLILGFAHRPAALVLTITMLVASSVHSDNGFSSQNGGYEYPLTLALVSLGLALTGPGSMALAPDGGWRLRRA